MVNQNYQQEFAVNAAGKKTNVDNIFDKLGVKEYVSSTWERDPQWELVMLSENDVNSIARMEVQTDVYNKLCVCIFFKNGVRRYMGLDKLSNKRAGDTIAPDNCFITKLRKAKTPKEIADEQAAKLAAGDTTPVNPIQYAYKILG